MVTSKSNAARWTGMALGVVLAACGTGSSGETSLSADRDRGRGGNGSGGPTGPTGGGGGGGGGDGAALYAANCAGCHGALASSGVAGASSASISAAIAGNVGGMGSITLTTAQVDAISLALGGNGWRRWRGLKDGATLYAANCAGCHGALATSQVRGRVGLSIRRRSPTTRAAWAR